MELGTTTKSLKHELPAALARALHESKLQSDQEFDLAMRILMSRPELVEVDGNSGSEFVEFFIVGKESIQATRTSFLSINWFSVASAVGILTRAPVDPSSYVLFLIAFAAALTGKLSQEQAAFFVATNLLEKEGRTMCISNLASKIGALIHKPSYSANDTVKLLDSLRAQGIMISQGPPPDSVVTYQEKALFLPV